MSYLVFARKWRPQTFGEIVGQKAVTQTLMNALASNRIAHAYLFAGPRGVGKTTAARILAKALNCEAGISREPCNTCSSCQDITQGRHLDVIEVDGASNRGIDEVRELRENVRFSPYRGRYKVIVIDEVHMLTEPAFNALLKTLEEPPSRVVFILATTESHKVPMTILSRCQRFEFRRIASADIIERLEEMGKAEDIKIDPEGLKMIASAAEGSLRDAQSLLDQVVSYSGARVRAEDVSTILGLVDQEQVEKAVLHVLEGDGAALLQLVEGLCSAGHDLRLFSIALLEWVRDLMVAHITDSATSAARESGAISSWLRKNRGLSFPELDRLLQILIRPRSRCEDPHILASSWRWRCCAWRRERSLPRWRRSGGRLCSDGGKARPQGRNSEEGCPTEDRREQRMGRPQSPGFERASRRGAGTDAGAGIRG